MLSLPTCSGLNIYGAAHAPNPNSQVQICWQIHEGLTDLDPFLLFLCISNNINIISDQHQA